MQDSIGPVGKVDCGVLTHQAGMSFIRPTIWLTTASTLMLAPSPKSREPCFSQRSRDRQTIHRTFPLNLLKSSDVPSTSTSRPADVCRRRQGAVSPHEPALILRAKSIAHRAEESMVRILHGWRGEPNTPFYVMLRKVDAFR